MFKYYFIAFVFLLGFLSGCKNELDQKIFLLKNSSKTGLVFKNNLLDTPDFNILNYLYYYNGGGVSVGDIDNDGFDDIFMISNLESNRLFLNKGNFQFEDITEKAGVGGQYDWSTGVNMVDINGDGYLDLYVCNLGNFEGRNGKNELFINNKDGTFTEAAAEYGLDFSTYATQSLFFDYDRDGDLDMYLLNHSIHTINAYQPRERVQYKIDTLSGDRLMRNNISEGINRFTDVTEISGIQSSPVGFGLGVSASDINSDGWIDLYISNDFHENDYLYINNGDGTFDDIHNVRLGHSSKYSMGIDINDFNNDGLPDIMTLDMLPQSPSILQKSMGEDDYNLREIILTKGYAPQLSRNTLQLNRDGYFSDVAPMMGVEATDWSWSPLFADLNNDGFKDIYITNGIYRRPNDLDYLNYTSNSAVQAVIGIKNPTLSKKLIELMPQLKISNRAFMNLNGNNFKDSAIEWGLDIPSYSNGAAYSDLDNDGDLELIVNNINEEAFIFENQTNLKLPGQSYLKVGLKGSGFNSMGIGAKIIIHNNNEIYYQEQAPVRGFMSSVSYTLHFGLGKANNIDSLTIIWPKGTYQTIENLKTNTTLFLSEKDAAGNFYNDRTNLEKKAPFFKQDNTILINYTHEENDYQEIFRETLIPRTFATEGPGMAIGDVNNDGLDDVFLTNAHGFPDRLFVQQSNGSFLEIEQKSFVDDSAYEGTVAVFFDADNDGDIDLYVGSGGNDYTLGKLVMADRLYINDGKGNFLRKFDALPKIFTNTSCVKPIDFDKDGDLDLFVGSRVIADSYGLSPQSYFLKNDGKGNFIEVPVTDKLRNLGMVTDAVWLDINNDSWPDLVVVGDWMPITFLINQNGSFSDTSYNIIPETNGWWSSIIADDFDNDGDLDLVVGNVGLNTKLKTSLNEPITLYLKDFDKNGSLDPLMTYYFEGQEYPFATKDQLGKQLNFIKKKYIDYNSFSGVTLEDLLSKDDLKDVIIKQANEFQSLYLENVGNNHFNKKELPQISNISPIRGIISKDINNDGFKDLIHAGNFNGYMPPMGRQDASIGQLLLNQGNNSFRPIEHFESGIFLPGEVRQIKWICLANNGDGIIVSKNNGDIEVLRFMD